MQAENRTSPWLRSNCNYTVQCLARLPRKNKRFLRCYCARSRVRAERRPWRPHQPKSFWARFFVDILRLLNCSLSEQCGSQRIEAANMRNAQLLLLTALIAGCSQGPANPLGPPPKPEVDVCLPKAEKVSDFEDFPGRIEAINSVE